MAQAQIDSRVLAGQIETQNNNISAAVEGINKANLEIQSLGNVRAQAVIDSANADITIQTADAVGKMKAQQAALKAATVIGTNLDDASELITSLGMKARDSFDTAAKARDEYFAKAKVGFFDNPLEYISNEFLGGKEQAHQQYQKAALEYNAVSDRLDKIAAQTTAHATAQAAITQTITAASVEALSTRLAQKAVGDAAVVKQQNLLYNISGIEAVMKMDGQKLDNYFKLNSAVMSEKHLAIAYAQLAQSKAIHETTIAERLDKVEQRKADRAEIEELGTTINTGRASLGLPDIPVGRAIQMMKMGGAAGQALKNQYDIGATSQETGKPIVADNAGRAARVIADTQAPLSAAAAPIKNMLLDALSTTIASNKKIDKKDLNQVDKATTELVKSIAGTMASNIKADDGTNIYQAPDMKSIAALPAVANTALFKKILAPAVENGTYAQTNPGILINQATNALSTRQISFEEAVDGITKIFKGAVALNNENKDYLRYGQGVTPQTTYITSVPTTPNSALEHAQKVDLTNPVAVSNLLSKRMSSTFNPLDSPANRR